MLTKFIQIQRAISNHRWCLINGLLVLSLLFVLINLEIKDKTIPINQTKTFNSLALNDDHTEVVPRENDSAEKTLKSKRKLQTSEGFDFFVSDHSDFASLDIPKEYHPYFEKADDLYNEFIHNRYTKEYDRIVVSGKTKMQGKHIVESLQIDKEGLLEAQGDLYVLSEKDIKIEGSLVSALKDYDVENPQKGDIVLKSLGRITLTGEISTQSGFHAEDIIKNKASIINIHGVYGGNIILISNEIRLDGALVPGDGGNGIYGGDGGDGGSIIAVADHYENWTVNSFFAGHGGQGGKGDSKYGKGDGGKGGNGGDGLLLKANGTTGTVGADSVGDPGISDESMWANVAAGDGDNITGGNAGPGGPGLSCGDIGGTGGVGGKGTGGEGGGAGNVGVGGKGGHGTGGKGGKGGKGGSCDSCDDGGAGPGGVGGVGGIGRGGAGGEPGGQGGDGTGGLGGIGGEGGDGGVGSAQNQCDAKGNKGCIGGIGGVGGVGGKGIGGQSLHPDAGDSGYPNGLGLGGDGGKGGNGGKGGKGGKGGIACKCGVPHGGDGGEGGDSGAVGVGGAGGDGITNGGAGEEISVGGIFGVKGGKGEVNGEVNGGTGGGTAGGPGQSQGGSAGAAGSQPGQAGIGAKGDPFNCPPNQTCCDGVCVDLQMDENNCGACGNVCAPGEECIGGDCKRPGCTDASACNYDMMATYDNSSCEYVTCAGCTDMLACNYDASATYANSNCEYESCAGCTDAIACNYDAIATYDNGSCEYQSCAGCLDPGACNYDATAICDDYSCEYISCTGCTDEDACNYDPSASLSDNSYCVYEPQGCTGSSLKVAPVFIDNEGNLVSTSKPNYFELKETLKCFPNPAKDRVTIQYWVEEPSTVSVNVFNLQGQEVANLVSELSKEKGMHTSSFDVADLPNGIYVVCVIIDAQLITEKLVINH